VNYPAAVSDQNVQRCSSPA